jgi:hypothetical protein
MSMLIFGVGGASTSMEMWDGYLLIIALIGATAKLAASPPIAIDEKRKRPTGSWRMRARIAGA